jgi:sugar phosphate isomerase/epimerase
MFKQGAFVNVLTSDSKQWKATLASLEKLPSLDHIELWLEHVPSSQEIAEIQSAFRGIPLIVHGPFIHTSLVSHIPEIVAVTRRRFDETVEFASKVDARVVTFHAGSYALFESRSQTLEHLASRFERFAELKDPVATLENLPIKSYGTTKEPIGKLSDCEEILKLLPKLRFTLDIGHSIQNEDDFVSFLRKHGSRVENIHLHDGFPQGRGHLRLGTGKLDLNQFLDTLKEIAFTGFVSMETISLDDTRSSWRMLCDAERAKGIRAFEPLSRHAYSVDGRNL